MLVAPSPKNTTLTVSRPRYLLANPAPTAMGTPPPTIPLAPSMFKSRSQMCIDPPLPWQYPVALPINSAIIRDRSPPLATRWPWPRCVELIWSSSRSAAHTPAATAS